MSNPSLSGWQVLLDPARPPWPGVLVVANSYEKGVIQVVAGNPRNFADSEALAKTIADELNHRDFIERCLAAHRDEEVENVG